MCPTRRGAVYSDLISGTVHMMFANMPSMIGQVRGGKVKGWGLPRQSVRRPRRDSRHCRDVAGLRRDLVVRRAAPPARPSRILAKLEAAIAQALANPDIQKRWGRRSRPRHPASDVPDSPSSWPTIASSGRPREDLGREARLDVDQTT